MLKTERFVLISPVSYEAHQWTHDQFKDYDVLRGRVMIFDMLTLPGFLNSISDRNLKVEGINVNDAPGF